jgi:hypothetical protein
MRDRRYEYSKDVEHSTGKYVLWLVGVVVY